MFIVGSIARSLDHYVGHLGFSRRYVAPEEAPFFAIVGRDSAQILLKVVGDGIEALPNHQRHPWAPWDVFIYVADPDTLFTEFVDRRVAFQRDLGVTDEGLLGFEIADPDGYVCFFGRPT